MPVIYGRVVYLYYKRIIEERAYSRRVAPIDVFLEGKPSSTIKKRKINYNNQEE